VSWAMGSPHVNQPNNGGFSEGIAEEKGARQSVPPMQSVWFKQNLTITFFIRLYLVWFGLSSFFAEALNGSDDGLSTVVVIPSFHC